MLITALPTIAVMMGANRIVRGTAITHPVGDPTQNERDERAHRRRLVDRALTMLETAVEPRTLWEVS